MKPSIEAKVLLALGALALVAFIAIAVNGTGGGGEDDSSVREATPPASTAKDETVHRQPEEEKPAPEKKEPVVPTIVVRGGEPVGGVAELSFDAGEVVRFKVESDVADELHLHGYDISKPVAAGGSATFEFPADIEGIFELELEERAVPLAELQVNP
ncbi:MAG: hypothetical protein AB7T48_02165 [Solirubrobacterales bacterium]